MYKLNKIYNVDCMEALEKIPDKSVDMILTDVPYKQFLQGGGIRKQRGNYDKIRAYGSVPDIDYHLFFEICLKKLKQINFLTFCNKETKLDFILMAKEKGFEINADYCDYANKRILDLTEQTEIFQTK